MINWLQAAVVAILTILVAFGLHSLDIWRIEGQQEAALADQQKTLTHQCEDDKHITSEVSKTYETQIMALTQQLDTLNKLRNQCVVIVSAPQPASGHNAAPSTNQLIKQNGITSAALIDYAGDAERYRLQLMACQKFITDTWAEEKQ